jgi:hypothetical protein
VRQQAASVETVADKRGSDAGAAADLEQAVARLDGKHFDRPANPIRYHAATLVEGAAAQCSVT